MNLLNYLFKKFRFPVYGLIAAFFGILLSLLLQKTPSPYLVLAIFFLISLIRTADDLFDFEGDMGKKPQYLSKKALIWLCVTFSSLFLISNILEFGLWGLFGVLFAAYAVLEEKFEFLQPFLMFLFSLYSILLIGGAKSLTGIPTISFLAVSLALPVLFGIYKRSKRK